MHTQSGKSSPQDAPTRAHSAPPNSPQIDLSHPGRAASLPLPLARNHSKAPSDVCHTLAYPRLLPVLVLRGETQLQHMPAVLVSSKPALRGSSTCTAASVSADFQALMPRRQHRPEIRRLLRSQGPRSTRLNHPIYDIAQNSETHGAPKHDPGQTSTPNHSPKAAGEQGRIA